MKTEEKTSILEFRMKTEEKTSIPTDSTEPAPKQRRGFGAMDPAKQREIARKGGKASHAKGTGHEWTTEAAREAGRLGGKASRGGLGKLAAPK